MHPAVYYMRDLVVGFGDGSLYMEGWNYLYLDDLFVRDDSLLYFNYYINDESNYLFVRKDSPHLAASLNRIVINGSLESVGVTESPWSEDYWLIGIGTEFRPLPTPEPATYGAVFSLSALGFAAWCRRRRWARGAISLSKRR